MVTVGSFSHEQNDTESSDDGKPDLVHGVTLFMAEGPKHDGVFVDDSEISIVSPAGVRTTEMV